MTKDEVRKMNDKVGHDLTKRRINALYMEGKMNWNIYIELIEYNCDCTDSIQQSVKEHADSMKNDF
jgi:hypothetical protein